MIVIGYLFSLFYDSDHAASAGFADLCLLVGGRDYLYHHCCGGTFQ